MGANPAEGLADRSAHFNLAALLLGYLRETVPDGLRAVAPSVEALALRIEASLAEAGGLHAV